MWKTVLWYLGLVLTFGLFVIFFGYLDDELAEPRRWFGCGLIVIGMMIIIPAARRLISDWPRMKPRHNVDLAFIQIMLGLALLSAACMLGGRAEAFLGPLLNPTPVNMTPNPDAAAPAAADTSSPRGKR